MVKKRVRKTVSTERDLNKVHKEWDTTVQKQVYGHAPEEQHFKVVNGQQLYTLKDLAQAFQSMEQHVFQHHVNELKNDFSTWVKDVFKNESLAAELKKGQSLLEAEMAVQRHVNRKLERLSRKLFYPKRM